VVMTAKNIIMYLLICFIVDLLYLLLKINTQSYSHGFVDEKVQV
jgi:hypothetical protein